MSLFSPSVAWPWKGVAFLSRLLLWGVIGVWLVFAFTWGAIHWVIVPRIGEWRSQMETLATRSVGLPVRLGSIQAQSDGTIPRLEITDLRLLDAQGNDALLLHRVVVSLSVRSLWRLGFEQVLIERPELDIRRTTQGHIRIAGLQVGPSPDATAATREAVEAAASDETDKPTSDSPIPPSTTGAHASEAVLDWLFSQPEFAIVGGRIRWTDEWQQQEPIRLEAVDFVLRNPGRRHMARLDATPSDGVSQRLSVRFQMRSPLLSRHPGRWQEWSGEAYGELPGVNLARLAVVGQLAKPLGVRVQEGQGALRLWVQWQRGEAIELTSDLALQRLHAHWADTPHALELRNLAGRVQLQQHAQGWELATHGLNFRTPEGIEWQNGSLRLRHQGPSSAGTVSTSTPSATHELEAKHINLAAVRELALGLPLPTSVLEQLDALEPQGVLETLQLQWTEDPHTPKAWVSFQAKGQATGLALKAQPVDVQALQDRLWMGRPGFQGANVAFELHQGGGEAKLSLSPNGQLVFPGVFDEATIPMQRFSAHAKWTLINNGNGNGNAIQVQLQQIRFANADAEGQAQATWQTSDPHTSPSGSRFPGILQLEGQLSRGKGERVHRYLPRSLSADVRQYVKQSVLSAALSEVRFRVNGDLYRFPFENPSDGEFRIQAKLHQAHYVYLPSHLNTSPSTRTKTTPPTTWPALRQLEGMLRFHGMGMSLDVQRALIDQAPGLRLVQGHASIAHFEQALLDVQIKLDGPLAEALRVVHRSPLAEMTAQVLKPVRGTGASTIQLGLQVPLQETERTQVKGQVQLLGNDVQWNPDAPMLGRVRGTVEFTHQGFWIPQASARLLGGEVQFSGGLKDLSEGGASAMPQFKAQGMATAEGLRQASFLGWPTALADHAHGQTSYTAQLGFKHGLPQIEVQTALQGMSLSLPAPMNKTAEALWPLQFSLNTVESANDTPRWQRLNAHLTSPEGPRLALLLQRDVQSATGRGEAAFSRGIVRIGADGAHPASIVPKGWILQVNTPEVDVSAWQQWATQISKHIAASFNTNTNAHVKRSDARSPTNLSTATTADTAWPERVWLKTALLHVDGRRFESVELEAQRQGVQWQANVRTRDMAGRFDYQMAQSGRAALLKARLDRLALQTSAPQVRHGHTAASGPAPSASLASPPSSPSTPSHRLPDLDVVIDALEIDGRAWGRLELSAANQTMLGKPPDWLLTQLKLRVPEAHLSATGRWGGGIQQRTELDFQLDVQDSGQLLRRFGMAGVFKGGKGQLMGHVGWPGSPLAMDSQQLSGQIELDIAAGQFLKADPGLAKLLGVLSLQSLPRRLALDFSDVFAQGFSFDFIRGDARIQHGVAYTNNLQMKGLNAAVLMEGKADIVDETQDLRVVVVPEINAGTASLIATVINPAIGLGTFLAQALLRQPLMRAATQEFRLHGTWADPQVDKINTAPASSITNAQSQ